MTDRLRFRVFYKVGKDWVNVTKTVPFILDHYGRLIKHGDFPVHPIDCPERFIVEQCTGLSDKNGNLIYEGDLIKSPNNSHPLAVYHDTTGLWRCRENRPNGIWELPLYDMVRNYTVEIIGNIHEQAEQKD